MTLGIMRKKIPANMARACVRHVVQGLRKHNRVSHYKLNVATASKCGFRILDHRVGKGTLARDFYRTAASQNIKNGLRENNHEASSFVRKCAG